MTRALAANLDMIRHVAYRLGILRDRMTFLGGAATGLLITDSATPEIRITSDVDVIVETVTRSDYYRLSDSLRSLGFTEDTGEDAPLCRWRVDGIAVDIMPTDEEILGFGNRWYTDAIRFSSEIEISHGLNIRVVTGAYFLATKIDAFFGRGMGDCLAIHDMEDMITVIDGRPEIVEDVRTAQTDVREFVSNSFKTFLKDRGFLDSLPGHLLPDPATQKRIPLIMKRIEGIAEAA